MKKILIIDDDPTSLKLTESRLKANGYEIHISSDAPEGLEKAMKFKPDLIILDVMMPVVNGYNFCRLIKTQESCRHIPIILLTSRGAEEDRKIGKEVGADAYITKPFNIDELLKTVRDLLGVSK